MKRTVLMVLLSLLTVSLLSGCIHLKEFTQEELDRISLNDTVQTIQASGVSA
ncbi:hypothetical protein [Marispirochaeta aestuarii]|uniref:hypothetical protein n=1 Tax=Marispirochaeta aestuarii TaxID=1963862 RepID=UPI0029C6BEB5|nr:hypothetical protein [Marispirochaeta aestuarii]